MISFFREYCMDNNTDECIKIIHLPPAKTPRAKRGSKKPPPPPKKRVVVDEKRWKEHIPEEDLATDDQSVFLCVDDAKQTLMLREIKRKLDGYRHQDHEKKLYDETLFVDLSFVVPLLQNSPHCFYCQEPVKLLYEMARDPKQWTLERIDNNRGHNKDNVEISCLSCNVKRRTMYHEKYRFTKQMKFVKTTT